MNVAVLGAGTMGNGIAQLFAQHGHRVVLRDLERPILDRALATIASSLDRLAAKGKLPAGRDEVLGRIQAVTELEPVASADLVVEAVLEKLEVKSETFAELDRLAPRHAILASNTSSI